MDKGGAGWISMIRTSEKNEWDGFELKKNEEEQMPIWGVGE